MKFSELQNKWVDFTQTLNLPTEAAPNIDAYYVLQGSDGRVGKLVKVYKKRVHGGGLEYCEFSTGYLSYSEMAGYLQGVLDGKKLKRAFLVRMLDGEPSIYPVTGVENGQKTIEDICNEEAPDFYKKFSSTNIADLDFGTPVYFGGESWTLYEI